MILGYELQKCAELMKLYILFSKQNHSLRFQRVRKDINNDIKALNYRLYIKNNIIGL